MFCTFIITKQLTLSYIDHSIRYQRFTINDPLWSCAYLPPKMSLSKYLV